MKIGFIYQLRICKDMINAGRWFSDQRIVWQFRDRDAMFKWSKLYPRMDYWSNPSRLCACSNTVMSDDDFFLNYTYLTLHTRKCN